MRRPHAVLLLFAACTSTSGTVSSPDAGSPDAAADSAPEPDVAPDLAPDVTPDLAPDVTPDLAPDLAPDAAGTLPIADGFTLHECETSPSGTACGTWVWSESKKLFEAVWTQGGHAQITLIENDARVVLRRFDPTGISQGLDADYTGASMAERKVGGAVTWSSPVGVATGTWTATW